MSTLFQENITTMDGAMAELSIVTVALIVLRVGICLEVLARNFHRESCTLC